MQCPACQARPGRHPRLWNGAEAILCGPCVLDGAGQPTALANYEEKMREAKAGFDAWERRHGRGLASMDEADQEQTDAAKV